MTQPATLISATDLHRDYDVRRGLFAPRATVHALAGVSFTLAAGKTLAVVGESGSGKSTLARLLTLIETPSAGQLIIDGIDVSAGRRGESAQQRAQLRRDVQIVFQNPYGSLNPRQTIGRALEEPLLVNTEIGRASCRERV